MGAGIGAGLGMAMGAQMANQMGYGGGPWGAPQSSRPGEPGVAASSRAQAVPPPPPPVEHVWHIAENGATDGPFSRADMGRMAQQGRLKRETLVWTPVQDGWLPADDVSELAQLFTVMPPPPPPPAG
jgi:hypothetical protein